MRSGTRSLHAVSGWRTWADDAPVGSNDLGGTWARGTALVLAQSVARGGNRPGADLSGRSCTSERQHQDPLGVPAAEGEAIVQLQPHRARSASRPAWQD